MKKPLVARKLAIGHMVYMHAVVAAFHIYAQCGEDAAKTNKIVMEITLLIMENHGKIMELCFRISVGTLPLMLLLEDR